MRTDRDFSHHDNRAARHQSGRAIRESSPWGWAGWRWRLLGLGWLVLALRPPPWLLGGVAAVAWCGLLAWAGWELGG